MNPLCNAYVPFNHHTSIYKGFEIVTVIEINSIWGGTEMAIVKTYEEYVNALREMAVEPFYRVNAIMKSNTKVRPIGDFFKITDATLFLEELTGKPVYIYSV